MSELHYQRSVSLAVWAGFASMCLGMFMAILDVQVVATSLPAIQQALEIDPDRISWLQTSYLIAEIIAIPLTGFLTRMLGMRWLFIVAISIFTLASAGCALSGSFETLIAWRVLQGFSGGTLIPSVFTAIFLLFPQRLQAAATTFAGVLAVLAPTVGPIVGGWVTSAYSWQWLFIINIIPGIIATLLGLALLPRSPVQWKEVYKLDFLSLVCLATSLATLEIALKEAPQRGWLSPVIVGLWVLSFLTGTLFVRRSLKAVHALTDLTCFKDRNFTIGCGLNFVFGMGLFGSVYLMPVFLAFVRSHTSFEIGTIMLVTGITQLMIAPLAVFVEHKIETRWLTASGFLVFGLGLLLSASQTPQSDYDDMFWPQILRGLAIMFCLLPPTRLALAHLPPAQVPDGSGLFNLMRNLGGAIGLALIDTVIYTTAPINSATIVQKLSAGDAVTMRLLGLPTENITSLSEEARSALQPLIETLALTQAINEAWLMLAILTFSGLLLLPFARRSSPYASIVKAHS